ncbi:hypothetical protein JHK84_029359 [Glycine max]|uniref:RING-type domain-containing protein n=1 Tax=Glycine soja TaxID=3848 RepID=A0A445IS82_GLYSO|nr:RING finger protein 44-like [Glycine soja]KAG5152887.1 hypothetical protein JHK84_029359 [Glycine max]KHN02744.1 E3 ubiquitin-protein ligase RNF115 [Glycine soja]RZB88942.1 hypothetical protein D0Y65_028018 [Glycine soja]
MAGRLPGVGLLARKRTEKNYRYEHQYLPTCRHSYYPRESSSFDPPWIPLTVLDETALKARQRLHKKLEHFFSSYRSSENPRKEGKVSQNRYEKKDGGIGRKLLECSWLLRGNKLKKDRKVCAVCLEDLGLEQQVMNLSCSHKYHSACLLRWLASHPHCPYCRTPVQPSPHINT